MASITHKHYMQIAEVIASASYCKRLQVGAVIVKDDNIISMGYNGTPSGFKNCCENSLGETHAYVLHAEANAISKIAASTRSTKGSVIYCTHSPCVECAKLIIQAKIKKVYYKTLYRSHAGLVLLRSLGIKTIQI